MGKKYELRLGSPTPAPNNLQLSGVPLDQRLPPQPSLCCSSPSLSRLPPSLLDRQTSEEEAGTTKANRLTSNTKSEKGLDGKTNEEKHQS